MTLFHRTFYSTFDDNNSINTQEILNTEFLNCQANTLLLRVRNLIIFPSFTRWSYPAVHTHKLNLKPSKWCLWYTNFLTSSALDTDLSQTHSRFPTWVPTKSQLENSYPWYPLREPSLKLMNIHLNLHPIPNGALREPWGMILETHRPRT